MKIMLAIIIKKINFTVMIFNNDEIHCDEFHCGKLYYESIFINFKNFEIIMKKNKFYCEEF